MKSDYFLKFILSEAKGFLHSDLLNVFIKCRLNLNRGVAGMSFVKKNKIALRFAALVVLTAFLSNFVFNDVWALTGDINFAGSFTDDIAISETVSVDTKTFTIPSHMGEIVDRYSGSSGKVVIHIQDAHCNVFAQKKISDIIDYLVNEYGISVLNLEGGAGEYDLSSFTSISDNEVRREVAGHFMKTGEISGGEYFAINNPERVRLWGIEDTELYLKNLEVYRDSLSYREDALLIIEDLDRSLSAIKRRIYGRELMALDTSYRAYKTGETDFSDYVAGLVIQSQSSGLDLGVYPNVRFLCLAMESEKNIDFGKANVERDLIVHELEKRFSRNEIRELVARSLDFRTKKITTGDFYNYLARKAGFYGIDLGGYPNFKVYLEYIGAYDSVDRRAVMDELEDLEIDTRKKLYTSDTQKELDALSMNLALLMNIFELRLTSRDYDKFKRDNLSFQARAFNEFISANAARRYTGESAAPVPEKLDEYLDRITAFYEYSFSRDTVFIDNAIFSGERISSGEQGYTDKSSYSSAMLMTGGFHTDNLSSIMREREISYVSIMPCFTSERGYNSPYFDLLSRGYSYGVERIFNTVIARVSTLAFASKLSSLGIEVWGGEKVNALRAAILIESRLREMRNNAGAENPGIRLVYPSGEDVKDVNGRPAVFTLIQDLDDNGELITPIDRLEFLDIADILQEIGVDTEGLQYQSPEVTTREILLEDSPSDTRAGFMSRTFHNYFNALTTATFILFSGAIWITARSGLYSQAFQAAIIPMKLSGLFFGLGLGALVLLSGLDLLHRQLDEKQKGIRNILSLSTFSVFMFSLPIVVPSPTVNYMRISGAESVEVLQTPSTEEIWREHWESDEYRMNRAIKMFNVSSEEELSDEARELANIALGENYAAIVSAFNRGGINEARNFFDPIMGVILNRWTLADKGSRGAIRDFLGRGYVGPITISAIIRSPRQFEPVTREESFYYPANRTGIPDGLFDAVYGVALEELLKEAENPRIVGPESPLFFSTPRSVDRLGIEADRSTIIKTSDPHHLYRSSPTSHHREHGISKGYDSPGSWFAESAFYTKYVASWLETIVSLAPGIGLIGALLFAGSVPGLFTFFVPFIGPAIFYLGHNRELGDSETVKSLTRWTLLASVLASVPVALNLPVAAALTLGISALALIAWHQTLNLTKRDEVETTSDIEGIDDGAIVGMPETVMTQEDRAVAPEAKVPVGKALGIIRQMIDSLEIHDEAKEDLESILSRADMADEDMLGAVFYVMGNISIAREKALTAPERAEYDERLDIVSGLFADLCEGLYPDIGPEISKYKSDMEGGILTHIRRSLEEVLRSLRLKGWVLEIDRRNGEVRVGRVAGKEEYSFLEDTQTERHLEVLMVEPLIYNSLVGGHGGTFRRIGGISGSYRIVADAPPVVFMAHSPEEVMQMLRIVSDAGLSSQAGGAAMIFAKKHFDSRQAGAPSIEQISALRIKGVADHEFTHRLHSMFENRYGPGYVAEGIEDADAYNEAVAFLGWLTGGDIFFRMSELVGMITLLREEGQKPDSVLAEGTDAHFVALNMIIQNLALSVGIELTEDMSDIEGVVRILSRLDEKELKAKVKEMLHSIISPKYREDFVMSLDQALSSPREDREYLKNAKWPHAEKIKEMRLEVTRAKEAEEKLLQREKPESEFALPYFKDPGQTGPQEEPVGVTPSTTTPAPTGVVPPAEKAREETKEERMIRQMRSSLAIAEDVSNGYETWIISPTHRDHASPSSDKMNVTRGITRGYRTPGFRGEVFMRGYTYSNEEGPLKESMREVFSDVLSRTKTRPKEKDARAICTVDAEHLEWAREIREEVVMEISGEELRGNIIKADQLRPEEERFSEQQIEEIVRGSVKDIAERDLIIIPAEGIKEAEGRINEVHYADIALGFVNFNRIEKPLSGKVDHERLEDVAARLTSHIRTVSDLHEPIDDPVAYISDILSGYRSLPRIEQVDLERWVEEHKTYLEIRRSL